MESSSEGFAAMKPKRRSFRLYLPLYLILLLVEVGPSGAQGIQMFGFTTRFQRSPQSTGDLILQKGTVLQPIDPQDRGLIFQSVVLCKDVVLHFGSEGRSQPVKIEGFCNNPGLPVPPSRVEWQVAELASPQVREKCDSKVQVDVRKKVKPGVLWRREVAPLRKCQEKTREECTEDFDAWLRTQFHKEYLTLLTSGKCVVKKIADPNYSVYGLYCDPL